jgi:hypothetical protein
MAGKDFKFLQILERRVCHQLMSRKVKQRYNQLEGFDRQEQVAVMPAGDEQWERIKDLLPGGEGYVCATSCLQSVVRGSGVKFALTGNHHWVLI